MTWQLVGVHMIYHVDYGFEVWFALSFGFYGWSVSLGWCLEFGFYVLWWEAFGFWWMYGFSDVVCFGILGLYLGLAFVVFTLRGDVPKVCCLELANLVFVICLTCGAGM